MKVYHRNRKTGGSDNWRTPPELFEVLNREFEFTIDLAAATGSNLLPRYYSPEEDSLSKSWGGENGFLNPPYSQIKAWVRHALTESQKPGTVIVCLIPARTGTSWFFEYVRFSEIRFLPGRLRFLLPNGEPAKWNAGFPSCIAIFDAKREPGVYFWEWNKTPAVRPIQLPLSAESLPDPFRLGSFQPPLLSQTEPGENPAPSPGGSR